MALGKLCQLLYHTKEAISIYKEVLRISKFSIFAVDSLLNMGIKLEHIPKGPSNMNIDWLNSFLKGKSHLISRDYKDAVKIFKKIDSNVN